MYVTTYDILSYDFVLIIFAPSSPVLLLCLTASMMSARTYAWLVCIRVMETCEIWVLTRIGAMSDRAREGHYGFLPFAVSFVMSSCFFFVCNRIVFGEQQKKKRFVDFFVCIFVVVIVFHPFVRLLLYLHRHSIRYTQTLVPLEIYIQWVTTYCMQYIHSNYLGDH